MALAGLLLLVSENTYRDATTTLLGDINLTDARIMSLKLVQLLADAEAAQYGYPVTGQPQYLVRHARAKAELAPVQVAVTAFFTSQGAQGSAATQRVAQFTRNDFALIERTLTLAQAGTAMEEA